MSPSLSQPGDKLRVILSYSLTLNGIQACLLLIEDLLFLGEGLHPELDVPQHVDGADASLILANDLDKILIFNL